MKYDLSDSFFDFFTQHGVIEFESILSASDLQTLTSLVETQIGASDPWKSAHNIWQKNGEIKKILFKSSIGEIASFLSKKKPLRLGYTQTISTLHPCPFTKDQSLEEISSVTPITAGALLCLSSPITQTEESNLPNLSHPKTGSIFFFSAKTPIPFPSLYEKQGITCLLFCFVSSKARYKLNPLDVHTHLWKRSGYAFGDLLPTEALPFLYH